MPFNSYTRRHVALSMLAIPLATAGTGAHAASRKILITAFGAIGDDQTVNTRAIQAAIDHAAAQGCGTVIVPDGVFVTGALFFKPRVNLHLEKGAVLRCSTDVATDFPAQRTRIEGHFEDRFTPALINAAGCNGFKISGQGTLDGAGQIVWDTFWRLRDAAPDRDNFPNLSVPRARLALIEDSRDVVIEGITFKDSQFWNLHLYRCQGVVVRKSRFVVPDGVRAPSSDGIDIDSCQRVSVEDCYFSVTDDCIAAKGSKGPEALQDKDSPPVEGIRIRRCEFRRGHGLFTCGSEATIVRDVVVEDCKVSGAMPVVRLKLRPDTPQHYENIIYRNLTFDASGGDLIAILPWSQYKNLGDNVPPNSVVRNVQLIGFRGRYGAFGTIAPNPGQTTISDIVLKNWDMQLKTPNLKATGVVRLRSEKVRINGRAYETVSEGRG
ncbi:glycoside hydrolase family 28 protein [Asticcacaulis sp. AND118]|uniref:glycoside hydrolase family 28 protein n=1 Tax=Asticcacaulis sp. AND118 TaxID=2840468 RepID=UPI001CFF79AE|nr:glycosyl hydrolase family 28 protein [Asticcacaulis sp. AND118]UDF05564.1 hypothetical protein LH365_15315 [Asticcacaulis sp. AND118]